MKRAGSILLLLACACSPAIQKRWPEKPEVAMGAVAAGDDPARILLHETRILMISRWNSPSYTQIDTHVQLRIDSEDGYPYADVEVVYGADDTIVSFDARTISPDGRVTDVRPARVYDDDRLRRAKAEESTRVRIFSFPDVEVGTVLEYRFTIETPHVSSGFSEMIARRIPVDLYRVEIELTKDLIYEIKAYNENQPWRKVDRGETELLTLSLVHVPALPDDELAPEPETFAPWWRYRLLQYAKYGVTANVHVDWSSTFTWRANELYFEPGDHFEGLPPAPKECTGACLIEKVVAQVHRDTVFDGFGGSWKGRAAKAVLDSGHASHFEKSRLVHRMLSTSGYTVWYAYGALPGGRLDRNAPYSPELDHVLLFVPKQPLVDADVWIDPSCEYCAPGELPEWSAGTEALVVFAEKGAMDKRPRVNAEWKRVDGKRARPSRTRIAYTLALDERGTLSGKIELVEEGLGAQGTRREIAREEPEEVLRQAERALGARIRNARLVSHAPMACSASPLVCAETIAFTAPGFAVIDGHDVLLPATFLRASWDGRLDDDERHTEVALRDTGAVEEDAVITLPARFQVRAVPPPAVFKGPGLSGSLVVSSSGREVRFQRKMAWELGRYALDQYPAMRAARRAYTSSRREVVHLHIAGDAASSPE